MKQLSWIFLLAAVSACLAHCEDATPSSDVRYVRVYSHESGLKPPVLLALNLPIPTAMKCEKKVDGRVELSLLVDTDGRARNIMFFQALGTDLDRFAIQLAEDDRFIPANLDGKPVVAGVYLRMNIQSCLVKAIDADGKITDSLQLRSIPSQRITPNSDVPDRSVLVSGPFNYDDAHAELMQKKLSEAQKKLATAIVHAPMPLIFPEAEYTPEAKKAHIEGKCLLGLIVDPRGMPKNIKIIKSLDPRLDQNAVIAVSKYRFKPAMKDVEPVAVYIDVEVNFRLY